MVLAAHVTLCEGRRPRCLRRELRQRRVIGTEQEVLDPRRAEDGNIFAQDGKSYMVFAEIRRQAGDHGNIGLNDAEMRAHVTRPSDAELKDENIEWRAFE